MYLWNSINELWNSINHLWNSINELWNSINHLWNSINAYFRALRLAIDYMYVRNPDGEGLSSMLSVYPNCMKEIFTRLMRNILLFCHILGESSSLSNGGSYTWKGNALHRSPFILLYNSLDTVMTVPLHSIQ